jgi:glutathione peroxidase-family protein
MRQFTNWCLVILCAFSLNLLGCDSGGGDEAIGAGEDTGAGAGAGEDGAGGGSTPGDPVDEGWSADGSISDMTPLEIPTDCGFDEALEGSGMGGHIANMKFYGLELEDGTKEKYQLHYDCGGGSKAVWVFLSTGWCGACNVYAKTVEKMYNAYKDQGLRVLWIVSEDGNHDPITKETFAEYCTAHAPMSFTVVRDPSFNGVYSDLDNTTPSLPHQYILDGTTMELIYKQGGTNKEGVKTVAETLGVDLAGVEELLEISFDE